MRPNPSSQWRDTTAFTASARALCSNLPHVQRQQNLLTYGVGAIVWPKRGRPRHEYYRTRRLVAASLQYGDAILTAKESVGRSAKQSYETARYRRPACIFGLPYLSQLGDPT
jgi:hypothetical protein